MNSGSTTKLLALTIVLAMAASPLCAQQDGSGKSAEGEKTVPVTVKNFTRAETDRYFGNTVKLGGFGKLFHYRAPTPIEKQVVVRMNRDTLYSAGVFDLDAGSVTIALPDTGKRFMSVMVITEDHYAPPVVYAPVTSTFDRTQAGTRYILVVIRTFADFNDPTDIKAANALQDRIEVKQAGSGTFEVPNWDPVSLGNIRDHLAALAAMSGGTTERRMGANRNDVDPVFHLMATATSWGLNPPEAAVYKVVFLKANDGSTIHKLTVKDAPVDGFWSISVYNAKGFFEKNPLNAYSINGVTAKRDPDGSYTIQFGGCTQDTANCLFTPAGWNYSARQYRPRKEVIDGSWVFPQAQPVK